MFSFIKPANGGIYQTISAQFIPFWFINNFIREKRENYPDLSTTLWNGGRECGKFCLNQCDCHGNSCFSWNVWMLICLKASKHIMCYIQINHGQRGK